MTAQKTSDARQSARVAAGLLPRVNLLPAEIRESMRLRAVRVGLAAAVLAATGLVALLATDAAAAAETARDELSAAQAMNAQVQSQVADLGSVRSIYEEVETTEAAVAAALATEIAWSRVLSDLSSTVPEGVWIETAGVTPGDGTTTYGTITYTGRGRSHDDVATWLEVLAAQPGLTDATFTTSARDESRAEPTVTFSSTATMTVEALASGTEG